MLLPDVAMPAIQIFMYEPYTNFTHGNYYNWNHVAV